MLWINSIYISLVHFILHLYIYLVKVIILGRFIDWLGFVCFFFLFLWFLGERLKQKQKWNQEQNFVSLLVKLKLKIEIQRNKQSHALLDKWKQTQKPCELQLNYNNSLTYYSIKWGFFLVCFCVDTQLYTIKQSVILLIDLY